MRKIFFPILVFTTLHAAAQPTTDQKKGVFAKVDSLVTKYIRLSTFTADGQNKVSPATVAQFTQLFAPSATLPDEMNPLIFSGDSVNANKFRKDVPIIQYASSIQTNYPEGMSVKLINSNVNYNELASRRVQVLLEKKTQGFRSTGHNFESHDTVQLNLRVSDDYQRVWIENITSVGNRLAHLNDADSDFVINANDRCPNLYALNGICPVKPKHVWITVGGHGGIASGTLTEGAYDYANSVNSMNSATKFAGGKAVGGSVQLDYFFGKKGNVGLGVGLSFSKVSGQLTKDDFAMQYRVQAGNDAYRQIITLNGSLEEEVSFSTTAIPIVLIFKGNISSKVGFRIEGGALYTMKASGKMASTNGNFDYEAVYNYDNAGRSSYDNGVLNRGSWQITRQWADVHKNSGRTVEQYFAQMRSSGYTVGLGESVTNIQSSSADFDGGVGFIFRPSLAINLSKDFALNAGFFVSSSSLSRPVSNYKLINEQKQYSTLLNGLSKASVTSFGLNVTLTHSIF